MEKMFEQMQSDTRLSGMFDDFRDRCMEPDIPEREVGVVRQIFFAGAAAMLCEMLEKALPGLDLDAQAHVMQCWMFDDGVGVRRRPS